MGLWLPEGEGAKVRESLGEVLGVQDVEAVVEQEGVAVRNRDRVGEQETVVVVVAEELWAGLALEVSDVELLAETVCVLDVVIVDEKEKVAVGEAVVVWERLAVRVAVEDGGLWVRVRLGVTVGLRDRLGLLEAEEVRVGLMLAVVVWEREMEDVGGTGLSGEMQLLCLKPSSQITPPK